jgi:hypothetical protein
MVSIALGMECILCRNIHERYVNRALTGYESRIGSSCILTY